MNQLQLFDLDLYTLPDLSQNVKIYFAGITGHVKRMYLLKEMGGTRLMLSYADHKHYNIPRFFENGFDLILDSGAFSMFHQGIVIHMDDYCEYITRNKIEKYIVLDSIGDFIKTRENQSYMEKYGLSPIPVFHYGTNFSELESLCSFYDYICLGGTVGLSTSTRIGFFRQVFSQFSSIRFHGLGVSDIRLIKMFPFYSVDSTSWLTSVKNNKIFDEFGRQVVAPADMSDEEKLRQTIQVFLRK